MRIKQSARTQVVQRRKRVRACMGLALTSAGAFLLGTAAAEASTITGTINTGPQFSPTNISTDGTSYASAPSNGPYSTVTVGEFDFTLPQNQQVTAATFSGNFGSNVLGSATATVELFLNGFAVATCDATCASNSQVNDVAWSFAFNTPQEFASLASGRAVLTALETAPSQIALDPTSATLQASPVPIPGALWLLGSGLASLVGLRRGRAITRRTI